MIKQPRTVLIIDDFPPDREVYRRYLQADPEYTYTIVEAQSAEEGLILCGTQLIDGILLDFSLPDLDGLEFLAELKTQLGKFSPPVVMITGQGNEIVAAKAIKNGAEDYLVKNHITPPLLQLAVRSAIENYKLQQKLQRSEERFRTSVDNMLDCFGIYTALRSKTGEIVDFRVDYLNVAALESNRITKEQIGQLGELLPAQNQSGLFAQYCQVVETGEPLIKESLTYTDKFGDRLLTRAYDLRASKLDDGLIISWRDVTEREQSAAALAAAIEQERIVTQIAQQIRQSLDLEEVLQTTVTEVRQFLGCDRVIIFQLQPGGGGTAIVESVGNEWKSLLSSNFYDPCFADRYIENYRQGQISAKTDIYNAEIDPCYVEILEQLQVKAYLVAPLIQGEVLWGLIIAHHCTAPRQWQKLEIDLIEQLSTSISIAIQQSELYQKAQNELIERQRAEIALQQQTQRERLVSQIAQRVRESLDLEAVFKTTVNEVRQFLGCDRVFIYRFHPDWSGIIVVEAVEQGWQSIVDAFVEDTYFRHQGQDYRQGRIQAVTDIYTANLTPCHMELLAQFQIRANLAVPILQGDKLWGLLVANQCSAPRKWESIEIELLQQLATQVGIAIQQADLFAQVSAELQERLKAEADLRESEAGLSLALEAAQMGTWNWNIQTGQIQWSANMEALFGLAPGEFDGSYEMFVNSLHLEDRDRVLEAINYSITTKAEYNIEFRIIYPNGQIRWTQSKGQVFYDECDRPLRMAGVDLDITERKQTQIALQENEALFRGVFESDLMGILFWNSSGQITDANDAFVRMTGYSRAEMQAGNICFDDITPPPYQELEANKFEILQTTGYYPPVEKEYICKNGDRLPILFGCAFLPGNRDRGVAFVLDISEQKQLKQEREVLLENERAARVEAEFANISKDEFLAMVSHELRSPLNAILGWARLLRTRKFDAATTQKALETIERNTQNQVQLIEDLLDVSRMTRGNLQLKMAPVQLGTVVETTIDSVSPMAEAKQIQLSSRIELAKAQVLGDLNRLQQIITNLVTNAIKFTPNGGRVEISLQQDSNQAQIQVTDTGKGISAEFLPHVFERFRRVDSSTTRALDGLGLGLAIASQLVELHGGTISAQSPGEGLGATFSVKLPILALTNRASEQANIETQAPSPLTGVRILVVDDNLDSLEFIAFAIKEAGGEIKTVASGLAALELLAQFQPDVLVSDIAMPEMDGYELLRRIRENQGKAMGAIALTAFAKEEDEQNSLNAGFQYHMTKPIEAKKLIAAIANLVATYNLELTPSCK